MTINRPRWNGIASEAFHDLERSRKGDPLARLAALSPGARGLRQCAGGVGLSCSKLGNPGGTVTFG
jgi:hypothetical protein